MDEAVRLSVVIPHLNQPDALRACLASVTGQRCPGLEIFVVDNGSREMPEEICAAFEGVRLLSEATPGPGPARNRGVAEARGDLLAFIDADCTAAPGWIDAIVDALETGGAQVIGGDVRTAYDDPDAPRFIEPYEAIYSYRNDQHIAEGFSGTGNLATHRAVMADVGPFAGIDVAEDRDWGLRANAAGYQIRYVSEMIIYHPARETFGELTQKWDRHIAHDYQAFLARRLGRLKWTVRAVAVAGSPLVEVRTVLMSPRVSGARERMMAFLCLIRLRLYRARRMITVVLWGNGKTLSGNWNRDG